MEPQPFGHGNVDQSAGYREMFLTFNGATAFRPWKRLCLVDGDLWIVGLQWSHSLSAMETRPVRPLRPLGPPPSMEPQPFGHGNDLTPAHRCYPFFPFNGATAFRPWKHRWRPARRWAISTFNGATAFRPWKLALAPLIMDLILDLQWSHSLSAMETAGLPQGIHLRGVPSMEPQPFGHGNKSATVMLTNVQPTLQWSHSLSAMETVLRAQLFGLAIAPFNGATAFRPWKRSRTWQPISTSTTSFNGATAFRPWKPGDYLWYFESWSNLQWSHSLSAMETSHSASSAWTLVPLQWSHSLSAMETFPSGLWSCCNFYAFNGATAFRPWKPPIP